jgi:hypothetical protein
MSKISADVLFCDDIRQETNGKFILIGVYTGDLIPGLVPATIPMAMLLRIHGLNSGKHQFRMTLELDGTIVLEQNGGTEQAGDNVPIALIFSNFPIQLNGPGKLLARVTIDGEKILAGHLNILDPASQNTPLSQ